jgi:hypothetical protein
LIRYNQSDRKGSDSRLISADQGKYTALDTGETRTLQGKLADGTLAFLTLNNEGHFTFGATASLEKLDALGLRATDLRNSTAEGQAGARLIQDKDGKYTGVYTLQGRTANGADAFATLSAEGRLTYGATGTVAQLNELGLRAGELVRQNSADRGGATVSRRIQPTVDGKYTVIHSDGTYTLQGKTANDADAFVSLGADGKYTFGATGTRAQLDALGLRGSYLVNTNAADRAGTDSRAIQGRQGKWTVVDSGQSLVLQGMLDDGTAAFATVDKKTGKYSFGATAQEGKLDRLGLRGTELVTTNRNDRAGTDSRRIQADSEGRYTVVESDGADTLQGKLADGTVAFASLDAAGKFSFGATAGPSGTERYRVAQSIASRI